MTPTLRRMLVAGRDVLPVVVVAWIVFHGIRTGLFERYLVPSRSMEPTLHGNEHTGDVVLVDKTAWWESRRGTPRILDLVVARNRRRPDGNQLVKRLVALGPARVTIADGDVVVQPEGQRPDRLVKHPLEHLDLRLTSFVVDRPAEDCPDLDFLQPSPDSWTVSDRSIVLDGAPEDVLRRARGAATVAGAGPGLLPHHLSTAGAIDSSFLDADGVRLPGGRVDVRDVGLELELELEGPVRALHLVVELLEVRYALELSRDGSTRTWRADTLLSERPATVDLPADRSFRLAFGYLDGKFFVVVDGALALWETVEVPWSSPRQVVLPGSYRGPPSNRLHVAVAGSAGSRARIHCVRGFHDVHYGNGDAGGYRLESGEIFLLGDNSFDSSDSRDQPGVPFRLEDLVGAPLLILAPLHRMRWL